MRNPEKVLNSLINHSKDTNYKFERLYRILYNRDMYLLAYQNIYAHEGNMTAGTDGETIDGMSLKAYVASQGGKIPYDQALTILMPVMQALTQEHTS